MKYFKAFWEKNKPILSVTITIVLYLVSFSTIFLFFFYFGLKGKLLTIILILYQYFIATKNSLSNLFLKSLSPEKYFKSFRIIFEAPIDEKKSLIPFHPHGILSFALLIAYQINPIL